MLFTPNRRLRGDAHDRRPTARHLRASLVLACASIGLGACHPGPETADATPPMLVRAGARIQVPEGSPLRAQLRTREARAMMAAPRIYAPGIIEAVPDKLARISAPLSGRILALPRGLGDAVRQGDVLFTLDSAELSTARGELAKTRVVLLQARRELDRQARLFEAEITPRREYELAQSAYAQAESDSRVAAARLAQLGVTGQGNDHEYAMRSPISGRVVELRGAPGVYWNDLNDPVMTVADLSIVHLSAAVSERDIAAAFPGQKVRISLQAYPESDIEGTVKYVGEMLDPDTRTVKVRIAIDNADGRLKPGMFAQVVLAGPARRVVTVPASALLQGGLYTRVFVERAPFEYEPRTVTVGATEGGNAEILSGLDAGEHVVVENGVVLND